MSLIHRLSHFALASSLLVAACGDSAAPSAAPDFGTATPAAEGIDATALATLIDRSTQQQSDAVIIIRDGNIVYQNNFGKPDAPIYGASVSKSFVSLAYGYLLADGKLASLDEKIVKYLPSFADNDPAKAQMTIRMLLSQTGGLKPGQAQSVGKDVETFSAQQPLAFTPGSAWQYSNDGADLAGVVVGRIAGEPIDIYLQRKLFTPLGINGVAWNHGVGGLPLTSGGVGGINIRPMDLAKVGQAILNGGKWRDKQIIPADYIALAEASSQSFRPDYGLYWWRVQFANGYLIDDELLTQWLGNGISSTIVDKLRPIAGTTYTVLDDYRAAVRARLTTDEIATINAVFAVAANHVDPSRFTFDPTVHGVYFSGYNGQYLVVIPDKHLVAVRMRQVTAADQQSAVELNANSTFIGDAYNLVSTSTATLVPALSARLRF